eukprot:c45847_g1_i1 orf=3-560(-)
MDHPPTVPLPQQAFPYWANVSADMSGLHQVGDFPYGENSFSPFYDGGTEEGGGGLEGAGEGGASCRPIRKHSIEQVPLSCHFPLKYASSSSHLFTCITSQADYITHKLPHQDLTSPPALSLIKDHSSAYSYTAAPSAPSTNITSQGQLLNPAEISRYIDPIQGLEHSFYTVLPSNGMVQSEAATVG